MLTQETRAELRTRADMIATGLTLDEQNDLLMEKLARLKMQIEGAKAEAAATGIYEDRDWFNRANFAYRMLAKEHQACLREIGERNRATRKASGASVDRRFISICRHRLDPGLFKSIMDEAMDEQHAGDTSGQ